MREDIVTSPNILTEYYRRAEKINKKIKEPGSPRALLSDLGKISLGYGT